ncbi:nucleolar protein 14-like [Centruroides sculpturatus]|uniref:nucleolar protein 14-like n=1 Tax=Centruroides sculpturatus TaxID=218467 RepID=UPI000C6EAF7E|nr:nucleolar protein 14-like [Centruroides sculpturatus]XP_023232638.1 nucleolar protein 14-like [Centruroides sculpturatus]
MGKKKKGSQNFNSSKNISKNRKPNPFELKVNREKHDVLGRKKRSQIGIRGASKRMGIQKRKNTLMKEYLSRKKCNNFLDRRINNENKDMSYKPFKKLRLKKSLFNLNDDEELTHLGQNISEMETLDKFMDSDDDDNDKLQDDFVQAAHFGGFLTEKKKDEEVKSRKELIQEIIAESKRKKYEKQTERENTIEITEKLDADWKNFQHLISKMKQKTPEEQKTLNSYDLLVNELKFDIKGKASDPLKTSEQLELEKKNKLRKLEMERLSRMKGSLPDDFDKSKYFSADSITTPSFKKQKIGSVEITSPVEVNTDDVSENGSTDECIKNVSNNNNIVIPLTLSDFLETVSGKDNLSSVLKEIVSNLKCVSNLNKYEMFFKVLLEYTCDIADNGNLNLLDTLIPYLYELAELSPIGITRHIISVLKSIEENFQEVCERKTTKFVKFPKFSTIIFLKLCDILYPASDFCHPVTTPATILLMRFLGECRIKSVQEVFYGLFVCNVALEYVSFSKRFLPEVLYFLLKLIFSTSSKETYPNAFKFTKFDLNLSSSIVDDIPKLKLSDVRKFTKEVDDCLKVQIINSIVDLTTKFLTLYSEYPSGLELFSTIKNFKLLQDTQYYPEYLIKKIERLITLSQWTQNKQLLKQKKQPTKCLRFLEPRIEDKFEGRKQHKGSKSKLEKEKLRYQYKRELKGAVKEIRSDNYFLANLKLNEELERDAERKQKVKELYRELAMQESDFKAIKKKKNR